MAALDHIGIAVESLDEALALWRDQLGLEFHGIEEVPSERVRVAFLQAGGTRIELLEPTAPDSPIARHLERRGAGLHHLAFAVGDLPATMQRLRDGGRPPLDEEPRPGAEGSRITFVHPKAANGVLVELVEPAPPGESTR
jgi:methylmalonyl-CoA/ethylmalonyl-CoA epimerase